MSKSYHNITLEEELDSFLIAEYSHLQYPILVLQQFDLFISYSVNLQQLSEAYLVRQDTLQIHFSMTLSIHSQCNSFDESQYPLRMKQGCQEKQSLHLYNPVSGVLTIWHSV